MDRCLELHKIFNGMKRYDANNIDEIPFNNGVYIFFEKGEKYHGMDRIVRVGTDTGQNNLRRRIKQHLLGLNKDHSVFRKNIGRAFLNKKGNYELLQYWNLSLTRRENKLKYFDSKQNEKCKALEKEITQYLQSNMEFVAFELATKEERLRFEEAIISTLYHAKDFVASQKWLGNFVPTNISGNHIVDARMWVSQGINAKELTDKELERLKQICYAQK